MATTSDFAADLKQRYEACRFRGRANYFAHFLFLFLAVSCSGVATVSVAVELWPKAINAVLAGLPAVMYLINRQFHFEAKSKWWFEKYYIIESLFRGVVYERRDEVEISKELTSLSKSLTERWPGFGEPPGK
jgi:hypothetical protein